MIITIHPQQLYCLQLCACHYEDLQIRLCYVKMAYNFVQEMKDYKAEVKVAKSRF